MFECYGIPSVAYSALLRYVCVGLDCILAGMSFCFFARRMMGIIQEMHLVGVYILGVGNAHAPLVPKGILQIFHAYELCCSSFVY